VKFISISWEHLFNVPNYVTERERATPAVGIRFIFEKKVFKKFKKLVTCYVAMHLSLFCKRHKNST